MGNGTLLIQCAEVLLNRGHQIYSIITSNLTIQHWAEEKNIAWINPSADLPIILGETLFDYFFSIANLTIVPPAVISLARKGAINFHDALLPKYAGLYATTWALLNREKTHGVTWHLMGDTVDAGDILKQKQFDITDDETAFTLNAKCYEAALDSFKELVDELASGTQQTTPQNLAEQTYFGKFQRPPAAAVISWNAPAEEISALVRALDFGTYENPITHPKFRIHDHFLTVKQLAVSPTKSGNPPGTVVEANPDFVKVATRTDDVFLHKLTTLDGSVGNISEIHGGSLLETLSDETADHLTQLNNEICKHETFWLKRLSQLEPVELPYADYSKSSTRTIETSTIFEIPARVKSYAAQYSIDLADLYLVLSVLFIARISGNDQFDLGFSTNHLQCQIQGFESLYATHIPLKVNLASSTTGADAIQLLLKELAIVDKHQTFAWDMLARFPELSSLKSQNLPYRNIMLEKVPSLDGQLPGSEFAIWVSIDGSGYRWIYQSPIFSAENINQLHHQFETFASNFVANHEQRVAEISLLTADEYHRIIREWNATEKPYPQDICVHQLIEAQVERSPDAIAVVFEDASLSYRALSNRANQLAHYLQRLNVGPDTLVGVFLERSVEMMVGLLGIHKAGGAYLPLDPTYPDDRITFMIEDAKVPVILTQERLLDTLPDCGNAHVICIDRDWGTVAQEPESNCASTVQPSNLCYVIYTSGSTGKPKGVMIEHRNVVNFFIGMDERLVPEKPGTWLAVTSLSFDISVLELFWTLARGFKVVIHADRTKSDGASVPVLRHSEQDVDFSLFYFASDEGEKAGDKYRLLLEGAKFADRNGFSAVWTPERHFHAFGGLYPNPSVASAAIAAITERVMIRAGSCVIPLHNPIRVAEEWALVDNISKGRVGIAFAAGWHPNDFVLRPETFADRKTRMFNDIEIVHRLWRGETVALPGPLEEDVPVRTLPRPIQSELPTWITVAGNPETFKLAGSHGYNILTHLLGQNLDELSEKIAIYRQAWRDGGYSGEGHITLMLHTFVGDNDEAVRETVREPMKNYLKSSVDLVKQAAWSFPAFRQRAEANGVNSVEIDNLTEDELEALLDHAFERYYETSGLFGTPETCLKMVDTLKGLGVDEIACLIDFGIDSETALVHLTQLNQLREMAKSTTNTDFSIPAQINRHKIDWMQCTPSMASMLLINEDTRSALSSLNTLLVGGEAFPVALARELKEVVGGRIINMYGPTETTIWSSTYEIDRDRAVVPIGHPIANTSFYILDNHLQPAPVGTPGELYIGGMGVVRGYLNRPELNEQRFVRNLFATSPEACLYRTGDLARYHQDGNIEFLGRLDLQVKIRGYRIELGEIETVVNDHPSVRTCVVIAREDIPGDKRLVAYLTEKPDQKISVHDLRNHLKAHLPEFMIPSHFVIMDNFPQTPNKKIDRKALPPPEQILFESQSIYAPPQNDIEHTIARIWQDVLNVSAVSINDNFFDIGGHSLLAVKAHRLITEALNRPISITDLFRFPTIRSLSSFLSQDTNPGTVDKGVSRAENRRLLMKQRLERRQRG
jgi:natural product biosynthesis luciferase-like monooxygenase protein